MFGIFTSQVVQAPSWPNTPYFWAKPPEHVVGDMLGVCKSGCTRQYAQSLSRLAWPSLPKTPRLKRLAGVMLDILTGQLLAVPSSILNPHQNYTQAPRAGKELPPQG